MRRKVGIVIVNYNDYKTTETLIKNIKDFKSIDLIVVVDNNSYDDSVKHLKKYKSDKLLLIESKSNKGYGAGNNIGIKKIIEELGLSNIIISNPDIILEESDLKQLLKTINSNEDYAIVAPIILEKENKNRGWKIPSPMEDVLQNIPYFHRLFRKRNLLYSESDYDKDITEVEATSGCFFIIKSDIIEKINYFDENLFLYYEENVLGIKIKNINKKIVIDNKAKVIHNHSVSIDNSLKKINKYKILKRSQYYFQKEYNKANVFERALLKLTDKVTLGILSIYYRIK
jgi:hypothetical protein